jgi:Fe-S-cluster containining protein
MTDEPVGETCSFDVCRDCKLGCCRDAKPPLTKERIETIEKYLNNNGVAAEQVFTHSDYTFPSVDSDDYCVFFDKGTKKCQIHEVKPETCRAGPLTFDVNFRTKKVEWFLKTRELCLLAGKMFDAPEKLDEHVKVAKDELMRLIFDLDCKALRAILTIDEPQTFKIGEDPLPDAVLAKFGLA